ncbi:receptor-interacting serine/threonine-protein kinase 3-like isoform X2 [Anarrhichthys ocellatus]|uniref:receptor-interacting serine/threonine-protein kinase 3-like isoform X2 n=1 Tax=Anarrhichthys ocellatus TaxID=433405 RepID=UPI0012EDAAD9|nr:receptor-interacting serine/threonine-protein kinase 3-like isoform X2 [Anarrhichthys ocellatus]
MEMEPLSRKTEPVGDETLEKWKLVGSGGFGHVYKARHKDWCFDVAIKILHDGVGMSLSKEAYHMDKGSCKFVVGLHGTYHGRPPGVTSPQQGLVMEFIGRGSVQSLLEHLSGPPQWPLVCRLAHQVALGMNFLHSQKIMHHDLKPSNVLLNDDLNAMLADFGLSRVSTSALNSNREKSVMIGGSYKYMPPEAFEVSYEPVRAFDIYSYGILLWSIITGKEPYPSSFADYDHVKLKIPEGDRPCCKQIDLMREREGLKELVDLMKRCWDGSPSKRPPFKGCLEVTENVFSKHENGIRDVVGQVLARLNSPTSNQSNTSVASSVPLQTPGGLFNKQSMPNDTVDNGPFAKTERSSSQDCARISRRMSSRDKAKFVDDNRATLIQDATMVMTIIEELGDMVHPEVYSLIDSKATTQKQMRELYQTALRSGGEKVKAAFYDALNKHQRDLVLRLGG